jgi:ABC-type nitrate/sulfonate/bicarbonate transport system permease component
MKTRSIFFLFSLLGAAFITTVILTEKTLAKISDENHELFDGLNATDIQLFRQI